jgi:flagellar basal-body rod protein FlgC
MDELKKASRVAVSGLEAQGMRLRIIAENMANAQSTTKTEDGDPYRRKVVTFKSELDREMGAAKVEVDRVMPDRSEFLRRYEPSHPAADEEGYVLFPNVNPMIELMDMREAERSYEANMNMIRATRTIARRMLELLRE